MQLSLRVLAVVLAFTGAAQADDGWTSVATRPMRAHGEHDSGPCRDMPRTCRRVDSARTTWGTVEVYTAVDARSREATPAMVKHGEYLAMYELVLPDEPERVVTETLEEGGLPNAHHYEMCGTASNWCERIASTTPRLSVNRNGIVTLVVTTITREQRWADARVAHGTIQVRHVRVRTVRCEKGADGWSCASRP